MSVEKGVEAALSSIRLHWSEEVKAVKSELVNENFETIDDATRQRAERLRSGVKGAQQCVGRANIWNLYRHSQALRW